MLMDINYPLQNANKKETLATYIIKAKSQAFILKNTIKKKQ